MFDRIADAADRLCAKPIAFLAFNLAVAGLFVMAGVDLANIAISIFTADLVLMGAGANRRGFKALQAKMDEIIHATDGARNEIERIEEEQETVIERVRR